MPQMDAEKSYKVWSCDREIRKSVIASNLNELRTKGAHKLGYESCQADELKLVLDSDGTEIEDEKCFQLADKDTVFLLLRADERWLPAGVEALKTAISGFPGNVTVVLHLDNREPPIVLKRGEPPWKLEVVSVDGQATSAQKVSPATSSTATFLNQQKGSSTSYRANLVLDGLNSMRSSSDVVESQTLPKQIHADTHSTKRITRRLGLEEDEEDDEDDSDTVRETAQFASPVHDHSKCDFHCSAFHVKSARSVATSPIPEGPITISVPVLGGHPGIKRGSTKGIQHVRFVDADIRRMSNNSEDSETDTTERDDEQLSERFLLLVDQLSVDQDHHLTLKDIGTILDRLSSKIVDVDKLEREKESQDCYNWIIKATIRGEVLREIGVIYNGRYYGIMEHPAYF